MLARIAFVVLVTGSVAYADDRVDASQNLWADRWNGHPVSVMATAVYGGQALGLLGGVEVDYTPLPWLYVSGFVGDGNGSPAFGGGIHLRQIRGKTAFSIGLGGLHTGRHTDVETEGDWLFPDSETDRAYAATTWATLDFAFEVRANKGVTFKLLGGIDLVAKGGTYTCQMTTYHFFDPSTTSECNPGTATGAPYLGVAIGYTP
jgi:hypothetical protein